MPLSPLLFAVVADILLRTVNNRFGDVSFLRAFADDTALVVKDLSILPEVFDMFRRYGGFSNLHLNYKKTVAAPRFLPEDWAASQSEVMAVMGDAGVMPQPALTKGAVPLLQPRRY